MQDVFTISRVAQERRRGPIDFEAADLAAVARRLLHEVDAGIARSANSVERAREPFRYIATGVSDPGDISKHCAGTIELAPEVEQHDFMWTNCAMRRRGRKVMRVSRVFRSRDVRIRVGDEAFIAEPSGHELLDIVLGRRCTVANPTRDGIEGTVLDAVQLGGRFLMRVDLVVVPHGREPLHEVAGRHDTCARLPHELDRARIDARDVRNRAARRVLHRHGANAVQETLEPRLELIAPRVAFGGAGQVGERILFDGVNEPARLASRWDQVIPAPRREVTALPRDGRHVGRDRIDPAEVVEQPAVDAVGSQCGLDV